MNKRQKQIFEKNDFEKKYNINEAVELAINTSTTKFEETIDICMNLNIDPKNGEQNVRGIIKLPKGLGKKVRVCVFVKEDKQQELITRQQNLREKVREFEQEMRLEERRLSEAIFKELKTVIRSISINENLDLVLEKNAAQVILYMKQDTTELTQKVIDEYNALKNSGNE